MTAMDQCPSTKKAGKAIDESMRGRDVSGSTGKAFWRSLDDLANTRDFRDFLQREFPAQASELLDGSRRHFLKIMGASLALAGASTIPGCRRPDHRILTYREKPEEIIPGKALFYATALPMAMGRVAPVIAETFEGRPTKLEGNPVHPESLGKSDLRTQAEILSLYDPDRDAETLGEWMSVYAEDGVVPPRPTPWGELIERVMGPLGARHDANGGAGVTFVVGKSSSPSRRRMRDSVLRRWPRASWVVWEPLDLDERSRGARMAFGGPHSVTHRFDRADVVVSLDDDFLGGESATLVGVRGWAANRIREGSGATAAKDTTMSRLYVAESTMTLTGGQADHRSPHRPAEISALAILLAQSVMAELGGDAGGGLRGAVDRAAAALPSVVRTESVDQMVREMALDLVRSRGRSLVTVGETQPAVIHALAFAVNEALGNLGQTVVAMPQDERDDLSAVSSASLERLRALPALSRETMVVIGGNPVFTAPGDVDFGGMLSSARESIYLGEGDETAAAVKTWIPVAHALESWGDVVSDSGMYSVVQPMIAPLFGGRTDLELLALLAGESELDPYQIVRETARGGALGGGGGNGGGGSFEQRFRRLVRDGVAPMVGERGAGATRVRGGAISPAIGELVGVLGASLEAGESSIDVVFAACPKVFDGRYANNGWLQELPDPITKCTWDNPARMSRATALRLGLRTSRKLDGPTYNKVDVARITVDGRSVEMPIWIQPGMPDNVISLTLGYGRRVCGRVGVGAGFDVNPLRDRRSQRVALATSVERVRGVAPFLIANTQDHWAMEGRAIIREVDLPAWHKLGDKDYTKYENGEYKKDAYGNKRSDANFASQLGLEAHTPVNRDVYLTPERRGGDKPYIAIDEKGRPILDEEGRPKGRLNRFGKPYQQWGMTIDLTKCTGCGTCTVACQAENNIPIVGKIETAKGREMHWIRVDRYYASEKMDESAFENPDMAVQPLACVHCENAPCEVVCPVNATVHSDEGLNTMAYNRCIGTRYCSNNCPYKVRRFNYFDYATKAYKGGFGQLGEPIPDEAMPRNQNLVPPRLREPIEEVRSMQYNPHVTVRSRGVIEKCTYCIQRINAARVETKVGDLGLIPDGFFRVACQQACPADAIVFGDIYDYEANDGAGSAVYQARQSARGYGLLSYLNTRPRTLHLLRVRNPNPNLRVPNMDPLHDAHYEGERHGGGFEDDLQVDGGGGGEGHLMSLPVLGQSTGSGPSPLSAFTQGVFS